jgi:6-phosphofructokinase
MADIGCIGICTGGGGKEVRVSVLGHIQRGGLLRLLTGFWLLGSA